MIFEYLVALKFISITVLCLMQIDLSAQGGKYNKLFEKILYFRTYKSKRRLQFISLAKGELRRDEG